MPATAPAHPGKLCTRLIAEQWLTCEQADNLSAESRQNGQSVVASLLTSRLLPETTLARILGEELGLPVLDLTAWDFSHSPTHLIPLALRSKCQVLPLHQSGSDLLLAAVDPTDAQRLQEIQFHTGLTLHPVIVEASKMQSALRAEPGIEALDEPSRADRRLSTPGAVDELLRQEPMSDGEEQPIVNFVDSLLARAIDRGASDIHLEPYEKSYRVRIRLDGLLHELTRPPPAVATRVATRLKVLAQLDISERRLPQDGRIRVHPTPGRAIDLRLNTLPTLWGEKIVLRVLDNGRTELDVAALGLTADQQQLYLQALHRSQGLILVTGPTGSGKSVTLYAGLNAINEPQRNIATAEDPVEIQLQGINQVAVNRKLNLDFATVLRALLRQDPDVIMVGEIRDTETAEIAVKAAQTGHLVLATLHTNSASETHSRLLGMGVPAYNLATALSLVLAQRLLRKLCRHCKVRRHYSPQVLRDAGFQASMAQSVEIFGPGGCRHCQNGYRGRIGIYEAVPINAELAEVILRSGAAMQFADKARRLGFADLRRAALAKVALGVTSLEEADRLT